MQNFGNNTPHGFLASEPNMENILSQVMNGQGGWAGLSKNVPDTTHHVAASEKDELARKYARMAATDDGRAVIEDLLNMTLRTAPISDVHMTSIESAALHLAERKGQNGIVVAILKKITDGRALATSVQEKQTKKRAAKK